MRGEAPSVARTVTSGRAELDLMAQLAGFELESSMRIGLDRKLTAESDFHVSVYRLLAPAVLGS